MDGDVSILTPEMITIQNNAETQPVIAYRTILCTVRTREGLRKKTNMASAVLGEPDDAALVLPVESPESELFPPESVAL
jgi:hypothetical protein